VGVAEEPSLDLVSIEHPSQVSAESTVDWRVQVLGLCDLIFEWCVVCHYNNVLLNLSVLALLEFVEQKLEIFCVESIRVVS